jgi:hypothetical protein
MTETSGLNSDPGGEKMKPWVFLRQRRKGVQGLMKVMSISFLNDVIRHSNFPLGKDSRSQDEQEAQLLRVPLNQGSLVSLTW